MSDLRSRGLAGLPFGVVFGPIWLVLGGAPNAERARALTDMNAATSRLPAGVAASVFVWRT